MLTLNILRPEIIVEEQKQVCKGCDQVLPFSCFNIHRGKGITKNCKICISQRGRYCPHLRKRTVCKDCGGGSYCVHDKLKTMCRDCDLEFICVHKNHRTDCRICSPESYLKTITYRRIYDSLGKQHAKMWRRIMGCSIENYKKYIEKHWQPDMNWDTDNWTIEYKVPIDFDSPTPDVKLFRFHYSNTYPKKISPIIKNGIAGKTSTI